MSVHVKKSGGNGLVAKFVQYQGLYSQKVLGLIALYKRVEFKPKTWPFVNTSPVIQINFNVNNAWHLQNHNILNVGK